MMDATTIPANTVSFRDFLFKDKRNRTILILAAVAMVIQWAVFKWFYPFASYIHGDSFSYLTAAFYNVDISTYLVGYSRFLRLFSAFTSSDTLLVAFQYLLIQSSALYLLFTIFYFYRPAKTTQIILLLFIVLNPLFLHLANLVSSDGFFLALSLLWFTSLLWIIHRPSILLITIQALMFFIAFTVRYNALIYPVIMLIAFGMSRIPLKYKLLGLGSSFLLCGLFIFYTSYKYKLFTKQWQYSPFSGWQLANNAMYTYKYIDSDKRQPVSPVFTQLDNMVRAYFDSTRDVKKYPIEALQASTAYMWSSTSPLYHYSDTIFKNKPNALQFQKWASMGLFYKSYGIHILKKYPIEYIRYFIWPNTLKYYAPPVEFLKKYNSGQDTVTQIARQWFGYKSKYVNTRFKSKDVMILDFYPILSGIMNIVMLSMLICYLILKGWKEPANFKKGLLLGTLFWLLNAGFTITASSAALRFQSFPVILVSIFAILMVDWMTRFMIAEQYNKMPASNMQPSFS